MGELKQTIKNKHGLKPSVQFHYRMINQPKMFDECFNGAHLAVSYVKDGMV